MQNNAKVQSSSRAKKSYFSSKPKGRYFLVPGLKGFICSCNFREKDCIIESYNLLNEYADKLYKIEDTGENLTEAHEDIDNLSNEITALKSQNNPEHKRFQVVESGAKNFLFIRTTIEDPVELAHCIMKDIHEEKKQKSRFLLRLIPIEVTCKAYEDVIADACKPLIQKYFSSAPLTYSIVFNHRNNNQLSKMQVITTVANVVSSVRSDHTVNLKDAEVSIVIEIIRNIALIGVIPNFMKYKKYNLHMAASDESVTDLIKHKECDLLGATTEENVVNH